MNFDDMKIAPKSTLDIAREWQVVTQCPEVLSRDAITLRLAEFADMLTKHLQFQRDSMERIATEALRCSTPPSLVVNTADSSCAADVAKLVEAAELAECLLRNLGHIQDAAEVDAALAPWYIHNRRAGKPE